jgi:hypothetical protein
VTVPAWICIWNMSGENVARVTGILTGGGGRAGGKGSSFIGQVPRYEPDEATTASCQIHPSLSFIIQICALLGYYAASNGYPLLTRPETSVKDYHLTLHNTPEERRSYKSRGGSLKHGFSSHSTIRRCLVLKLPTLSQRKPQNGAHTISELHAHRTTLKRRYTSSGIRAVSALKTCVLSRATGRPGDYRNQLPSLVSAI